AAGSHGHRDLLQPRRRCPRHDVDAAGGPAENPLRAPRANRPLGRAECSELVVRDDPVVRRGDPRDAVENGHCFPLELPYGGSSGANRGWLPSLGDGNHPSFGDSGPEDQRVLTIRASPWPPPPQSAAAPGPPPRRLSSWSSVRVMRVPDMPIGWPSAIAPPLTLVISSVMPRSFIDATPTAAKASLSSNRSMSPTDSDARSSACLIERDGWVSSDGSGPATWPYDTISPSGSPPRRSAASLEATITAAAPSEICEALPAVMLPALSKAGRSLPSDSTVVSLRTPSSVLKITGSPLRCGISTLTISASNSPSFCARAARSCDLAASSSCSSRPRPADAAYFSVAPPIANWSMAQNRPSCIIESTTLLSPMRIPARASGSRYGAFVMDSMPPATTTSA